MRKALFAKATDEDERRDAMGRWTRAMEAKGVKLNSTTGIMGMSRDQIVAKVHRLLDGAVGEPTFGRRMARYAGAALGFAAGSVRGVPPEVTSAAIDYGAHLGEHVAEATSNVVGKALASPRFRRLAVRFSMRIKKSLDNDECSELKNIIATAMADTRMPPQVNFSDAALTEVAQGAYRHLHGRVCNLSGAA